MRTDSNFTLPWSSSHQERDFNPCIRLGCIYRPTAASRSLYGFSGTVQYVVTNGRYLEGDLCTSNSFYSNLQLLHSAVISFSFLLSLPPPPPHHQWAAISQSARFGRSGNRGSIPWGAKDVFRHYVLTKTKPVQSPGEVAFLWGKVTL